MSGCKAFYTEAATPPATTDANATASVSGDGDGARLAAQSLQPCLQRAELAALLSVVGAERFALLRILPCRFNLLGSVGTDLHAQTALLPSDRFL